MLIVTPVPVMSIPIVAARDCEIAIMPITVQTGQSVTVPGIYKANHCGSPERTFPQGHTAPPCPGCHSRITWTCVRATHTKPTK